MSTILNFRSAAVGDRASRRSTTTGVDRDNAVVVVVLLAVWLAMTLLLFGSIADSVRQVGW
jgi:hypothetical protein